MMKKSLLIASVFLMGASSMPAQTVGKDPGIFEPATIGGKTYHLTSDWAYMNGLKAEKHAFGGAQGGFAWATNACRTACIYKYDGKDLILITDNTNQCCHIFDFETGEYLRDLAYTLDGAPFGGVAESNQIGVDDFGHIYLMGYGYIDKSYIRVYTLDFATGAVKLAFTIDATGEIYEGETIRIDYCDIIGDITGEKASCRFLAASQVGRNVCYAYLPQGSKKWKGGFNGDYNWNPSSIELNPANAAGFGAGCVTKFVRDKAFSGELFYIDGQAVTPTLYDKSGQVTGTFADRPSLAPNTSTNGVAEATVAGNNFVFYVNNQAYTTSDNTFSFASTGEGYEFADMVRPWIVPSVVVTANNVYHTLRRSTIETKTVTDKMGRQAIKVLVYDSGNILALYTIAEENFGYNYDVRMESIAGKVGESIEIRASVIPEDAPLTDRTISWTSSNPGVAAVDNSGKVWFNAAGSAVVSAEYQERGFSVPITVEEVVAQALNVFPMEAVGNIGHQFSLLALHEPDNTTDKSVSWETSDPSIATVDSDGRVELTGIGSAQITARSGEHTAVTDITVTEQPTGVTEIASTGVVIDIENDGITVRNAPEGASIAVYNLDGRIVNGAIAESTGTHLSLAPGIYTVKITPDTIAKVLIK